MPLGQWKFSECLEGRDERVIGLDQAVEGQGPRLVIKELRTMGISMGFR